MSIVETIEQLEAIYGYPNDASTVKVADRVTPSLSDADGQLAVRGAGDDRAGGDWIARRAAICRASFASMMKRR